MENRLQLIGEAAAALFINQGYARTQIKDIASKIGLSTGMIYVYFKGKREILHFILKCAVDPDFLCRDFVYPIGETLFSGLDGEIEAVLRENSRRFGAPLAAGDRDYPFGQMLSDAFDTIARYGTGCLILEKNLRDVGAPGDAYLEYRKTFCSQVLAYLQSYIRQGSVRPLSHPELTAQLIIETLAWWGMHVMNDVFEIQRDIPPHLAKEVCLDNLLNAYARR